MLQKIGYWFLMLLVGCIGVLSQGYGQITVLGEKFWMHWVFSTRLWASPSPFTWMSCVNWACLLFQSTQESMMKPIVVIYGIIIDGIGKVEKFNVKKRLFYSLLEIFCMIRQIHMNFI